MQLNWTQTRRLTHRWAEGQSKQLWWTTEEFFNWSVRSTTTLRRKYRRVSICITTSHGQMRQRSTWEDKRLEKGRCGCSASDKVFHSALNPDQHGFYMLEAKLKAGHGQNKQEVQTAAVKTWQSITGEETCGDASMSDWLQTSWKQVLKLMILFWAFKIGRLYRKQL